MTVSPEVLRIRGVAPDFTPRSIEFFFDHIHPEDGPRVRHAYEAAQLHRRDFAAAYGLPASRGEPKTTQVLRTLVATAARA